MIADDGTLIKVLSDPYRPFRVRMEIGSRTTWGIAMTPEEADELARMLLDMASHVRVLAEKEAEE